MIRVMIKGKFCFNEIFEFASGALSLHSTSTSDISKRHSPPTATSPRERRITCRLVSGPPRVRIRAIAPSGQRGRPLELARGKLHSGQLASAKASWGRDSSKFDVLQTPAAESRSQTNSGALSNLNWRRKPPTFRDPRK